MSITVLFTYREDQSKSDSQRERAFRQAIFLCLWVCVFVQLGVRVVTDLKERKRKRWYKFGWNTMRQSIHKSVETSLKQSGIETRVVFWWSFGTGSILECQNETKSANMESKGNQKEAKAYNMKPKWSQRYGTYTKRRSKIPKGRHWDVNFYSGYSACFASFLNIIMKLDSLETKSMPKLINKSCQNMYRTRAWTLWTTYHFYM